MALEETHQAAGYRVGSQIGKRVVGLGDDEFLGVRDPLLQRGVRFVEEWIGGFLLAWRTGVAMAKQPLRGRRRAGEKMI